MITGFNDNSHRPLAVILLQPDFYVPLITLVLCSPFCAYAVRRYRVKDREIEEGKPSIEQGLLAALKEGIIPREFRERHHCFVSFKSDPDEQRATTLARRLSDAGLNVEIVAGERFEFAELSENVGEWEAISYNLEKRIVESAAVVVVVSPKTFESLWVANEFAEAMSTSSLVLLLMHDGVSVDDLFTSDSIALKLLLTAPTFVVDYDENNSSSLDGVARVLRGQELGKSRIGRDVFAAAVAGLLTMATALVLQKKRLRVQPSRIALFLLLQHSSLRRLQHAVQAPQSGKRQNHPPILRLLIVPAQKISD